MVYFIQPPGEVLSLCLRFRVQGALGLRELYPFIYDLGAAASRFRVQGLVLRVEGALSLILCRLSHLKESVHQAAPAAASSKNASDHGADIC